jgi:hypothetical protein
MKRAVDADDRRACWTRAAVHAPLPLDRLGEALELTRTRPDGFMKALVTT